ncbi:hypothetical protein L1987_72338 [Smallanthus sonchifolius]|uniref:Uncharacterized protein n=1 Tax=Smallanthus sonchifolius TaxID=185202 RepID=A0ACB9AU37_9ASTR|nr:hypothetical protein L1987_72338 [Smallanthus sonchifolius]
MFKAVLAASHLEFSTTLNIEQSDPARSFKFGTKERLQCPSGKFTYNKRNDYILSLNIQLKKATNKIFPCGWISCLG